MSDLHNKLTVGLESHRSLWVVLRCFLQLVFPGFSWVCNLGPDRNTWSTARRKCYATSDRCDVTLRQVCQLSKRPSSSWITFVNDDIIFSTVPNDSKTPHVQFNAAFCTLNVSRHKLQDFQWLQCQVSSSSQMTQFYLQVNVNSNMSPAIRLESNSAHHPV